MEKVSYEIGGPPRRLVRRSGKSDPDPPGRLGFGGTWVRESRLPRLSAKRWRERKSRHSGPVSRFCGAVQQGPVQRQEWQIVQSQFYLRDLLP